MKNTWKINEYIYSYVENGRIKQKDLLEEIRKHAQEGMYLYAELEDKVCLGVYKQGKFLLGDSGTEKRGTKIIELTQKEIPYLLEIRVFNLEMEWLGIKEDTEIYWRIRRDKDTKEKQKVGIYDELHKIWGRAVKERNTEWTLLEEQKGSRILFPMKLEEGKLAGLQVRRYLEFNNAAELEREKDGCNRGLIEFIDDRFLGIEEFKSREDSRDIEVEK